MTLLYSTIKWMLIRTLVVIFELFPAGTGLKIACLPSKTSRSNLTGDYTIGNLSRV